MNPQIIKDMFEFITLWRTTDNKVYIMRRKDGCDVCDVRRMNETNIRQRQLFVFLQLSPLVSFSFLTVWSWSYEQFSYHSNPKLNPLPRNCCWKLCQHVCLVNISENFYTLKIYTTGYKKLANMNIKWHSGRAVTW